MNVYNSALIITFVALSSFGAKASAEAQCVKFDVKKGHLALQSNFKATGRLEMNPFYLADDAQQLRAYYGGVGRFAYVLVLDEPVLIEDMQTSANAACKYEKLTIDIGSRSRVEDTLKTSIGRRVQVTGAIGATENSDQIIRNGLITFESMIPTGR